MPEDLLSIGEVAAQTGVATSTLRYYDELGLVKPNRRTGGQRRYGPEAVSAVTVIVFLREVGFTLAEITGLLESRANAPTAWRERARRKLDELDRRIEKSSAARDAIEHSLRCKQDDILACPMFWQTVAGVAGGHTIAEAHRH